MSKLLWCRNHLRKLSNFETFVISFQVLKTPGPGQTFAHLKGMNSSSAQFIAKVMILSGFLTGLPASSWAEQVRAGYVQDVTAEKNEQFYEIYLSPPTVQTKIDYRSKIFDQKLTTEFRDRYEQRFGYIDTDSMAFSDRFTNFSENRGANLEMANKNDQRKQFAEYMMKRLGEYHFDNYMKSDPSMRPVYEMKEKMSSVSVEVTPESKLSMNYSVADNSIDVNYTNPYADTRLRTEMDPRKVGPADVIEQWVYIGKQVTKTIYMMTTYAAKDGWASVEFRKSHSPYLSTSTQATTTTTPVGIRTPRQSFFGYNLYYMF